MTLSPRIGKDIDDELYHPQALVYYFLTTLMAVILGIIMVMAISPGSHGQTDMIDRSGKSEHVNTVDSFLDLLR